MEDLGLETQSNEDLKDAFVSSEPAQQRVEQELELQAALGLALPLALAGDELVAVVVGRAAPAAATGTATVVGTTGAVVVGGIVLAALAIVVLVGVTIEEQKDQEAEAEIAERLQERLDAIIGETYRIFEDNNDREAFSREAVPAEIVDRLARYCREQARIVGKKGECRTTGLYFPSQLDIPRSAELRFEALLAHPPWIVQQKKAGVEWNTAAWIASDPDWPAGILGTSKVGCSDKTERNAEALEAIEEAIANGEESPFFGSGPPFDCDEFPNKAFVDGGISADRQSNGNGNGPRPAVRTTPRSHNRSEGARVRPLLTCLEDEEEFLIIPLVSESSESFQILRALGRTLPTSGFPTLVPTFHVCPIDLGGG